MTEAGINLPDWVECGCYPWYVMMAGVTVRRLPKDGCAIFATHCTVCGENYLSFLNPNEHSTLKDIRYATSFTKSSEAELNNSIEEMIQRAEKLGVPRSAIDINKFTIGRNEIDLVKDLMEKHSVKQ